MTKIDNFAFFSSSVTEVVIGKNVQEISNAAFQNCMNLERVTFAAGSKLEYIGIVALVNNGMRQFSFPGNDKYWLEEGSLYYRATTNEGDQIVFMAPPPEESIMGLDLPSVRLHVYPEAMQKYMNAPYWQLILYGDDLTGEEPRAITSPEQETTELGWSYQPDGTLHLESQSSATMRVTLYSTDGASIATLELAPHATAQLTLPTAGIYLLSVAPQFTAPAPSRSYAKERQAYRLSTIKSP